MIQSRLILLFRRRLVVATAILSLAVFSAEARAHVRILAGPNHGSGSATIFFAQPIGQSFTADHTSYTRLGLWIEDVNASFGAGDYSLDYSLYDGEGTGGTLLGTQSVTVPGDNFNGFVDADFSNIALTIGNIYSLVATQDTFRWGSSSSNDQSYGGGTGITGGGGGGQDRGFRAVPEPSSVLLMLVATAMIAARRRR